MFFQQRIHTVREVERPEELARLLTGGTWCNCNGWKLGKYLYLNDSTCPDGAQEYGVINSETGKQVESITFGWCSYERALTYILEVQEGKYEDQAWSTPYTIDHAEKHTCHHCA